MGISNEKDSEVKCLTFNAFKVESAMKMVAEQARSMGITVSEKPLGSINKKQWLS